MSKSFHILRFFIIYFFIEQIVWNFQTLEDLFMRVCRQLQPSINCPGFKKAYKKKSQKRIKIFPPNSIKDHIIKAHRTSCSHFQDPAPIAAQLLYTIQCGRCRSNQSKGRCYSRYELNATISESIRHVHIIKIFLFTVVLPWATQYY